MSTKTSSPKDGPKRVMKVDFKSESLPPPHSDIATAPDPTVAVYRNQRPKQLISFNDDGKLFEGHLTVQSRSLKAIIQSLVNQQEEQSVIIHDLQDQLSIMRVKAAKASKGAAARAGKSMGGPMDMEEMAHRLRRVENFMLLWGTRPEEVASLIESYGDPVVTPDPYTGYLLELPCFRTTRREARAGSAGGGQSDPRRAPAQQSRGGQQRDQGGRGDVHDDTALQALHAAEEALERISRLEERGGGGGGGGSRSDRDHHARDNMDEVVDEQARQDIEELSDYVTRRLREVEARATAGGGGGGSSRYASPPQPSSRRGRSVDVVDDHYEDDADRPPLRSRSSKRASNNTQARTKRGGDDAHEDEAAEEYAEAGAMDDTNDERTSRARSRGKQTSSKGNTTSSSGKQSKNSTMSRAEDTKSSSKRASSKAGKSSAAEGDAEEPSALRSKEQRASSQRQQRDDVQSLPPAPLSHAHTQDSGFVDTIAREDAATSLELIEDLERMVDKRLRDLQSTITKMERSRGSGKGSAAENFVPAINDRQQTGSESLLATSPAEEEEKPAERSSKGRRSSRSSTPRDKSSGKKERSPKGSSRNGKITLSKEVDNNSLPSALLGGGGGHGHGGPSVDKAAREEIGVLADHVADMEEDVAKRLQAFEERLRIIGRTTMSPASNAPAASVDRKAREDASLSLMRIQHIERELAMLRRSMGCPPGDDRLGGAYNTAPSASSPMQANSTYNDQVPMRLRDTYTSKVDDLEKEVEQRMADVNRAIALLKSTDDPTAKQISLEKFLMMGTTMASAANSGGGGGGGGDGLPGSRGGDDNAARIVLHSTEGTQDLSVLLSAGAKALALDSTNISAGRPPTNAQHRPSALLQDLPLDSLPSRQKHVTRLRSPTGPSFGCSLVVRDVVPDDSPTATAAKQLHDQSQQDQQPHAAATAAEQHAGPAAPCENSATFSGSNGDLAKDGDLLPLDPAAVAKEATPVQHRAAAPRRGQNAGGQTPRTSQSRGRAAMDALGHATPCVVMNCAWCAADTKS